MDIDADTIFLYEYRASLVELAFSQCPDTQVVMSGYSQGAQVVHLAAADLPAATMAKVGAVVTFGDPGSCAPILFLFHTTAYLGTRGGSLTLETPPPPPNTSMYT